MKKSNKQKIWAAWGLCETTFTFLIEKNLKSDNYLKIFIPTC